MGTLRLNLQKFLGTFSEVIDMMVDVGLLSSRVFSYAVAQDMSNMVWEESHIQAIVKFLEEGKSMLNELNSLIAHNRNKEGFEEMVLSFQNRQDIVSDGLTPCNNDGKSHDNSFASSCGTTTYAQMKNSTSVDVGFNSASQHQYTNLSEARCEMPSGRFSPLDESQFNAADALSRCRHYAVADSGSCYDIGASSVGHENSLSSHGAAFNLPNHMVVNSHFQQNCDSAFDGTASQLMRFPSCSRDSSMKQFPSASESQNHDSQYVSHDKSQDFSSKPSCEFAQPNEAGDSQHFTSPRGHFSPTAESNCDTMYASRCETTQDAHFSCDTTYETSNHSGLGMHNSNAPFQPQSEQPVNAHFSHPSLSADASFGDPSKNQHVSAFSMVNTISSAQYSSCRSDSEKTQFLSDENAQNKMHYSSRNTLCGASFPPLGENNSFVGIGSESCNSHVASRGTNENRYSHVSSFKWGVLNDTEDGFDTTSPVPSSNQAQDNSEFSDLQMAFSSQVTKSITVSELKHNSSGKEDLDSPAESRFSLLLGIRDVGSSDHMTKKKLAALVGLKQEGGKWKCPLCAKLFIARVNFERHFKVQHLGEKAFPCHLCDRGFSSKIRLDAHLMRQHNINCESANPCSVCGKLFNTKTALKTHSLTHVGESEKPFACNICSKRFSQKVVLDTHLLRHGGPASYKYHCKICSKSFPTKPKLKFHSRKHEGTQFACKECPKQFPNESLLRSHEATHIAFDQRPFQCSECPKAFTTKHKLQMHLETHNHHYSCRECSDVFKCSRTLVSHRKRCHPKLSQHQPLPSSDCSDSGAAFPTSQKQPPPEQTQDIGPSPLYKCSMCSKEFNRKSNFHQHEINCQQDIPQQFPCENCPKLFKSKAKLKIHLATHTGEPNLACRTCGRRFYRTDLLRAHEATHTGNKPFSCEVCARRFVTQSMLRSHQVIHQPPPENVPEVPCPTCDKKFKNKRTLALHVKSHADDLEFKCGVCGKQFARRGHFDGHMRTHSADRPYSCTVCNRTFRERKHRKDHMRRLHPNEILGGGELTLQKLIDSISTDDTMDAPAGGGSFETDVNSDALESLTGLSTSGMQHLLEDSSQRNGDSQMDDNSQSQHSQLNSSFGSQSRNLTMEPQVESVNPSAQVNRLGPSFSSQHSVNLDCQTDISASNQVNHLPQPFSDSTQNLAILQNPFHHLKSPVNEPDPFSCPGAGALSPLPELAGQLQSMEAHSCSHSGLHSHLAHTCAGNKETAAGSCDESLPKLSDVLAISMQGDL